MSTVDLAVPTGSTDADTSAGRLNWLRAGILGANDGIVSVAAIVMGVAGAGGSVPAIAAAGMAGLIGGAISMALGEYVSVSGQLDAQRTGLARIEAERAASAENADQLAEHYIAVGVSAATARAVAEELVQPAVRARRAELAEAAENEDLVSPWRAAWVSAATFTVGALLPLIAVLLASGPMRAPATFIAVLIALVITGVTGATLGRAPRGRATLRVVVGGALALAATYGAGALLGGHL